MSTKLIAAITLALLVLIAVTFFGRQTLLTLGILKSRQQWEYDAIPPTPEQIAAREQELKRRAEDEALSLTWFHNLRRKKFDAHVEGYSIIKTNAIVDSTHHVYSLVILRNDSLKFRTEIGVEDSNWVGYVVYPLIPNGRKQVIVDEFTGGAHCCALYWILDLADTVHSSIIATRPRPKSARSGESTILITTGVVNLRSD